MGTPEQGCRGMGISRALKDAEQLQQKQNKGEKTRDIHGRKVKVYAVGQWFSKRGFWTSSKASPGNFLEIARPSLLPPFSPTY